jgi:hypothetical protein
MACIASILNISLSETPDIWAAQERGEDWWIVSQEFVARYGYKLKFHWAKDYKHPRGQYYIVGGDSPRGTTGGHACVALNGKIVHDPHPDRTGLTSVEEYYVFAPTRRLLPE